MKKVTGICFFIVLLAANLWLVKLEPILKKSSYSHRAQALILLGLHLLIIAAFVVTYLLSRRAQNPQPSSVVNTLYYVIFGLSCLFLGAMLLLHLASVEFHSTATHF